MKIKQCFIHLALIGAFLLVSARPTLADPPPGLQMQAAAAFDGYVKYGEWLPVWVELENSGADLDAEIRVQVQGNWNAAATFATAVALPGGSRKRVPVYVLPNNFTRQLQVQLVDSQNQVLISQQVSVKPQINLTLMVGLIAPTRGAMSIIANMPGQGQTRPVVLVDLSLTDLPDQAAALASFDCLVWNDTDTSALTPEQKAALESWVGSGGRLVIGGGAGARQTVAGLPDSLLPIAPRREIEVDALPGLTHLGGQAVRVPGPFLAAVGDENPGYNLAVQDDLVLVRERAVGSGYVDFVSLDLAVSPFDAWAGTAAFWYELIWSFYPQDMPSDMSIRQMRAEQTIYALTSLPSLDLPSIKWLSILLCLYILLVGPINYLVLRWRKRLHWAWATIPALTLLFSGGAFGLGYALRGNDLIVNKIALVVADVGGVARITSYIGVFSPAQQSYEITVPNGGLLSPMTPSYDPWGGQNNLVGQNMVFVQGTPGRVRGLAVNQWSMQTFMTEDIQFDMGAVTWDLRLEQDELVGWVRNDTAFTLHGAAIVLGNMLTRLGDLAPGVQTEVRWELSSQAGPIFGPSIGYRLFEKELSQPNMTGPAREVQVKQQVIDNFLGGSGKWAVMSGNGMDLQSPTLLAWLDRAPPDVQVAGRAPTQQTTALFYMPLDWHLAGQEPVSIPAGLLPGRVVQMPVEGGMCGGTGVPAIYVNRGEAILEFQLPASVLDLEIDRLLLSLHSDGGWGQTPQVSLYRWDDQSWFNLEKIVIGSGIKTDWNMPAQDNIVVPTDGLIHANGRVQVRLSVESNASGGCFYVGLGLQGQRP